QIDLSHPLISIHSPAITSGLLPDTTLEVLQPVITVTEPPVPDTTGRIAALPDSIRSVAVTDTNLVADARVTAPPARQQGADTTSGAPIWQPEQTVTPPVTEAQQPAASKAARVIDGYTFDPTTTHYVSVIL